jgi:hypothetical protein
MRGLQMLLSPYFVKITVVPRMIVSIAFTDRKS